MLTRDDILQADDLERRLVEVPEWGGSVWVRALRGDEYDEFQASILEGKGTNRQVNVRNLRAKLVVRAVVNEEGERLFDDADFEKVGKKSSAALNRLFTVAQELSAVDGDEVEALVGNSETGPSDS